MEIWKPIPNYEDTYEVSSLGNVRSVNRIVWHPRGYTMFLKGKVLKPSKGTNGYLTVILCKDGVTRACMIHLLVAYTFLRHNNSNPDAIVNHKNGKKTDNSISNIEIVTHKENSQHALKNGLIKSGEKAPRAKLSNVQANKLRELYFTKKNTIQELTVIFGLSRTTVYRIIKYQSYKSC